MTHAGSEEERNQEEQSQHGHVPNDRSKGDDSNSKQSRLDDSANSERLHEQVTNDKNDGETDRTDDLTDHNRLPRCSGHITGELLGGETEPLSLETGNSSPRQPTVSDPRVGVGSTVTSRHPSKELSVINDKVGERELMRVEQEWSDTKTKNGDPEVDDVGDKDRHGDVEQ